MPASLEIDELNATMIRTHGVRNLNVGSVDRANIAVSPLSALTPGTNAYVKYNQLHVTDLGSAAVISNVRIWLSSGITPQGAIVSGTGLLGAGEKIQTSLDVSASYAAPSFDVPNTRTYTANTMSLSDPGTPNIGIDGTHAGTLTAPGYTDIWKWQVQLSSQIRTGPLTTKEFVFAWDEV